MTGARLRVRDLTFEHRGRVLWHDLDLRLESGASVAVRGPSGSGKSTLLRCLGGLERPTAGTIHVDGVELSDAAGSARRALRRGKIGLVSQDHVIVPEWTVRQNIGVVRPRHVTRRQVAARTDEALEVVGLTGLGRARAGRLRRGEQQRVAVARVLVQRPTLVLADEPTASLDDASSARVLVALGALRARGSAVVVATHDERLASWCGEVLRLGP